MKEVIIGGAEYVPKAEEKAEVKEWPQNGDKYYFVTVFGCVGSNTWGDGAEDESLRDQGIFRTKKEAEQEALRRECMATRWVPEDGAEVFIHISNCYLYGIKRPSEVFHNIEGLMVALAVMVGLAGPSVDQAKARWDKYGEAWIAALTPKK